MMFQKIEKLETALVELVFKNRGEERGERREERREEKREREGKGGREGDGGEEEERAGGLEGYTREITILI